MKNHILFGIIILMLGGFGIGLYFGSNDIPESQPRATIVFYPENFYDAEGNQIPNAAVHALVRSQFVIISKEDSILLHDNFPCSDLYTP